jgi:hypothetical protein
MMDPNKLQYFTTASWLRGYAQGLDEHNNKALIHKMNQAATLLEHVWSRYVEEQEDEKFGGTE